MLDAQSFAPDQIYPVLFAYAPSQGLWPMSELGAALPCEDVLAAPSLFEAAIERVKGPLFASPWVVASSDCEGMARHCLKSQKVDEEKFLIDPVPRGTAVAALWAALALDQHAPDGLMLLVPSETVLPSYEDICESLAPGLAAARSGALVLFGSDPLRPDPSMRIIEAARPLTRAGQLEPVVRTVPSLAADTFDDVSGDAHMLWHSGFMLCTARTLIAAFEAVAPELLRGVFAAQGPAARSKRLRIFDLAAWTGLPEHALEDVLFEGASDIRVGLMSGLWRAAGDWQSAATALPHDGDGNVIQGAAEAVDCKDCCIVSADPGCVVVGLGLTDTVVSASEAGVLVANLKEAGRVAPAVGAQAPVPRAQNSDLPRDFGPWGMMQTLAESDCYTTRQWVIAEGESVMTRAGFGVSSFWVVVSGAADVVSADGRLLLAENQSVETKGPSALSIQNHGKLPLVAIETECRHAQTEARAPKPAEAGGDSVTLVSGFLPVA